MDFERDSFFYRKSIMTAIEKDPSLRVLSDKVGDSEELSEEMPEAITNFLSQETMGYSSVAVSPLTPSVT